MLNFLVSGLTAGAIGLGGFGGYSAVTHNNTSSDYTSTSSYSSNLFNGSCYTKPSGLTKCERDTVAGGSEFRSYNPRNGYSGMGQRFGYKNNRSNASWWASNNNRGQFRYSSWGSYWG